MCSEIIDEVSSNLRRLQFLSSEGAHLLPVAVAEAWVEQGANETLQLLEVVHTRLGLCGGADGERMCIHTVRHTMTLCMWVYDISVQTTTIALNTLLEVHQVPPYTHFVLCAPARFPHPSSALHVYLLCHLERFVTLGERLLHLVERPPHGPNVILHLVRVHATHGPVHPLTVGCEI